MNTSLPAAVTRLFYSVWLLSMPFYLYSLVGTLSLDNILAPIVFALLTIRLVFSTGALPRLKFTIIIVYCLLFTIYACGRFFSVIANHELFAFTLVSVGKQFIYLFLPILFINSQKDFILTSRLILIVAVIGIFSALLSSVGLVEFPVERYAESRIGITSLKKAIGLFANFGDMAILGSYAILFMYIVERRRISIPYRLVRYSATLLLLAGYLGTQSRNMYLTLIGGIFFAAYYRLTMNRSTWINLVFGNLVVLVCIAAVAAATFFEINTLESVKGFGGTKEAAATVDARLTQYVMAWGLFQQNPFFGHAVPILEAGVEIHNLWLGLMALGGVTSTVAVTLMFLVPFLIMVKIKCSHAQRSIRLFGVTQLICVFIASEFYGAMTYIFLVVLGTLSVMPVIYHSEPAKLHPPKSETVDNPKLPTLQGYSK